MPSVKGISTYQTYLMYRTTTAGSYEKLIDITSFPDLIPPKERIDITSLSDYMRVYINGIGDTSEFQFGARPGLLGQPCRGGARRGRWLVGVCGRESSR